MPREICGENMNKASLAEAGDGTYPIRMQVSRSSPIWGVKLIFGFAALFER